jgi:hypothetical protein
MRYRFMATYRGIPYEAGVGPTDTDIMLFAACPPPEELGFQPATGHWRKAVTRAEVDAIWESRPSGVFGGEPCLVLDDLGDQLHIGYPGHDPVQAERLGYCEVEPGVFEVLVNREDVAGVTEERVDRRYPPQPSWSAPAAPAWSASLPPAPMASAPMGPGSMAPGSVAPGSVPVPAPVATQLPPAPLSSGPMSARPLPPGPIPPDPLSSGPMPPGPYTSGSFSSGLMPPGPLSSGPLPSGPLSSGPLSSGPLPSRPLSSGALPSGPLSSGPLSSGPLPSVPVPAGPLSSGPLPAWAGQVPRRRHHGPDAGPSWAQARRTFTELADLAAIRSGAYAVDEEVDGAMCLVRTESGYEVFNSVDGTRQEIRLFADEEAAYFYLFGLLAAEAVRDGRLVPGRH